jgi:hypothetical protein
MHIFRLAADTRRLQKTQDAQALNCGRLIHTHVFDDIALQVNRGTGKPAIPGFMRDVLMSFIQLALHQRLKLKIIFGEIQESSSFNLI